MAVSADAEITALAGPHTQHINLAGRSAIPGIFDSHNHLLEVGAKLSAIRLDECQSPEEMMELVRQRAKSEPGKCAFFCELALNLMRMGPTRPFYLDPPDISHLQSDVLHSIILIG